MKNKFVFGYIFILGSFFYMSCQTEEVDLPEINQSELEEIAENVHVMYSDSAYLKVELTANEMIRHLGNSKKEDIFTGNVHITFYDNFQNIIGNVFCEKATRITSEYKFILEDQVVLTNPKGEKMETSQLIWLEKENFAYSDRFCKITRSDEILEGFKFQAKDNLENFSILNLTGRISVKNPELNK